VASRLLCQGDQLLGQRNRLLIFPLLIQFSDPPAQLGQRIILSQSLRAPCYQASIVVWAPAKANPLRCIGFLKNFDLVTLCRLFNNASGPA
jgi:hypothetical protein